MENANYMLLEDRVPVYSAADITSVEIAKLNNGDEIILDEKFRKNRIQWASVILSDDRKGFMRADAKGVRICLAVLKQASADVYKTPGTFSKIILTYHRDDEFQIIGGEKQDDVMWIKTESSSGIIGFVEGGVKVEKVEQTLPSQKWPVRGGYIGACVAVAIVFYFAFLDDRSAIGIAKVLFVVAFIGGFLIGYLFTEFFIRIKRSMGR
jgi:hypothetical protein